MLLLIFCFDDERGKVSMAGFTISKPERGLLLRLVLLL